jgi:hypothetical protein
LSEDYRHYAAQCLALAQAAEEASIRAHLLNLAALWRSMAEKAEIRQREPETSAQGAP